MLVTGHRRENFGAGFERICAALAATPAASRRGRGLSGAPQSERAGAGERLLSRLGNVHLIEPLDYLPFVYLMDRRT